MCAVLPRQPADRVAKGIERPFTLSTAFCERSGVIRSRASPESLRDCRRLWFNNRPLLEPIGNIPPAEAEERYYAMLDDTRMAAQFDETGLRQSHGGSHPLA